MQKLYEILCIVTGLQLFLFSIFLLTLKRHDNKLSLKILAIFFLSKAIAIIDIILYLNHQYLYKHYPYLFFWTIPFSFLFGPSLYLYTKSVINNDLKLAKKDSIHLLPFLLYFFYIVFSYHIYSSEVQKLILKNDQNFIYITFNVFIGLTHLFVFGYMIGSLRLLYQFGVKLKDFFSNLNNINLNWLNFILIGFIIMWLFHLFNYLINIFIQQTYLLADLLPKIMMFSFSTLVLYKALKQPKIFMDFKNEKCINKSLSHQTYQHYLDKINLVMVNEKPFLDSDLSLKDLADKLSISSRKLSKIINESLQQNFFDFINSYRINEAKHVLSTNNNYKQTILEILYDVGFNSKSAFNSAFKKHTGMTPSEFKKKNFHKDI